MGTITKNYIIIILFEKNYNEERMSVLSSLETSSSPASPSSCRKNHLAVSTFNITYICQLNCDVRVWHGKTCDFIIDRTIY
jgi:hypothetical protein